MAPHCETYAALDPAPAGLENIRSLQKTMPGLAHVTLYERFADQLQGFEPASFDTIIINSVIQLFPDFAYLRLVVDTMLTLVRPGGCIFLGDAVNLAMLETLQVSLQLFPRRPASRLVNASPSPTGSFQLKPTSLRFQLLF